MCWVFYFLMLVSFCSMLNTFNMVWVYSLSCEQIVYRLTSIGILRFKNNNVQHWWFSEDLQHMNKFHWGILFQNLMLYYCCQNIKCGTYWNCRQCLSGIVLYVDDWAKRSEWRGVSKPTYNIIGYRSMGVSGPLNEILTKTDQ